jgi:hypothetical protein
VIFALLTFFAAFLIEGLGTYVSVIGLSALFGSNPIIIALAVALDLGKIIVVTLLYKYWKDLGILMKSYALIAAAITMIITSAGASGYLAGEFQKAISGTQESSLKVGILKEEQAKLEARKRQIDDQIANLPSNFSRSRVRLMKQFEDEQKSVTARLNALSSELPALQIAQIGVEAKAGPIIYISKAFDIPVEEAVKWVILMIIFVFDPLAVFLLIAANFLMDKRNKEKAAREALEELDIWADEPDMGNPKVFSAPLIVMPPSGRSRSNDIDHAAAMGAFSSTSPAVEPVVIPAEPDASEAKVYTRDEVIALNPKYAQELTLVEQDVVEPPPAELVTIEPPPAELTLVEPEVVEPEVVEPDVVEPDVVEPDVVEPDVVEPDVVEPEVVEPDVVEPEVVEPEVVEPSHWEWKQRASSERAAAREQITLSSLGAVKADPATDTGEGSMPRGDEIGTGTGVFKS